MLQRANRQRQGVPSTSTTFINVFALLASMSFTILHAPSESVPSTLRQLFNKLKIQIIHLQIFGVACSIISQIVAILIYFHSRWQVLGQQRWRHFLVERCLFFRSTLISWSKLVKQKCKCIFTLQHSLCTFGPNLIQTTSLWNWLYLTLVGSSLASSPAFCQGIVPKKIIIIRLFSPFILECSGSNLISYRCT